MTIKDKLMIYVYRKGTDLEKEIEAYKMYSRFCPADSLEHYEYMRAIIRLEAWKEFLNDIFNIIINCK